MERNERKCCQNVERNFPILKIVIETFYFDSKYFFQLLKVSFLIQKILFTIPDTFVFLKYFWPDPWLFYLLSAKYIFRGGMV